MQAQRGLYLEKIRLLLLRIHLKQGGPPMKATMLKTMLAAAIDQFGGVEAISVRTLPVPEIAPDEVLIHVESAGVGVWDPFEREGGFHQMLGRKPTFPYVLGSEGAGTIEDVGEDVTGLQGGRPRLCRQPAQSQRRVLRRIRSRQGRAVSLIPGDLSIEQAGVMPVDAITGLQGLDDMLDLKAGESVMIFGASGGIGHLAVQLAKRMGARVFAVASGDDGVALAEQLGADAVVDGHKDDVAAAALEFAPGGLDAALITAGGTATDNALDGHARRRAGRLSQWCRA